MKDIFQNVAAYVTLALDFYAPNSAQGPATFQYPTHWPGWSGITHMVVFGDSYARTGFNSTMAQPSGSNPLGNPAYPGYTSSNGPNWVDFMTTTYNETYLRTINLADGGATVDSALVEPYLPTVLSLKDQIRTEYLPKYSSHPPFFDWKADNTLFASFFGINDVDLTYAKVNAPSILTEDLAEYASLMDEVYQTGARNFLFLNVPPVNRSPLTTAKGPAAEALEASYIDAYNTGLTLMAANLSTTYPDAKTFLFDTNQIFTKVLDSPCSYPETCAYLNTTEYCVYYEHGTTSWYSFNEHCSIAVDEYFWLNPLHPTFRIHNATAKAIVAQLGGQL